jgi:hypothetical protein
MLLLFSSSIASPSSNNNKYSTIDGVVLGVIEIVMLGVTDTEGVADSLGVTVIETLGVILTEGVTLTDGVSDTLGVTDILGVVLTEGVILTLVETLGVTLGVTLTATYSILKDFVSVLDGTVRLVTVTVVVQISPDGRFVIVTELFTEGLVMLLE